MVTEVIETPTQEADQVPSPEVTEDVPVVEQEVAAPEVVEAAAEPVQLQPEEPRYTQAQLDQIAADAAQRALEGEQHRRQAEGRRREQEQALREREQSRLQETIEAQLLRAGVNDDELVKSLANRVATTRTEVVDERVEQAFADDINTAISYFTGQIPSSEASRLNPRQVALTHQLNAAYQAGQAAGTGDTISRAEHERLLAAARAAGKAESQQSKTELKRPEGQGPGTSSVMSWTDYQNLPEADRLSMSPDQRREIMAADRKARLQQ